MTTYRLPYPAELARNIQGVLPRQPHWGTLCVRITPRDRTYRRCAVHEADHYEVQAFYATMSLDPLGQLEAALVELPGVYMTTLLHENDHGANVVANPAWPAALGHRRRGFRDLRPQVLALMRD